MPAKFKNWIYLKPEFLKLFKSPDNPKKCLIQQHETQPKQPLTSNIPPITVTNDKLLVAIFPFELKKLISMSLFSRTALEEKPITAMYTDAKVDGHSIKLILDN
ncbi:hypothetical protein G9A89_000546, partial [Geosiphon pyriformis]